ncbi:APC family permease [Synechococcus sp. CS-1328]|uniref:APC family permease n=1 Tax=Synechococcus sp. CS-1328 TaxID=2847976 RepID=UPI00223AAAD9|nr:APC family permease [Synechococcus sp. CS-1328]MCT0224437.1 APC family permease [Synechococcus sp. CS-1328]
MPGLDILRRRLIGTPLPTSAHHEERYNNAEALAILSSDALSSVAYATQEIVLVLGMAGAAALSYTLPITALIVGLMLIVATSYRQTIKAYPQGGGSYRVSQQNLGQITGLVAGASLSIDYVLTVAVSVAAGIAALTSYFPALEAERIPLCLLAVVLVMLANLRGVSSSAKFLSMPTYLFMGMVVTLLVAGAIKTGLGQLPPLPLSEQQRLLEAAHHGANSMHVLGPLLLMRAFSSGCAALTGIEAISDSVAAFRPVEWRNARRVLVVMVLMLALMFSGISALAHQSGVVYAENGPTLLYQLGERIFGNGILLFVLQMATLMILLLAANTAYADFPRLAAFLAQDGFLPRQLSSLGDRLVFSNGIYALSGLAGLLLVIFNGSVSRLIPLYAVGVFISFTLSQAGMVMHWWKLRERGWISNALLNGFGALITALVGGVLLFSKFTQGAWLVVLAIPLLVSMYLRIRTHYNHVARRLRMASDVRLNLPPAAPQGSGPPTVVLVGQLHRGTFEAICFARSVTSDLVAVHVDLGGGRAEAFRLQWERQIPDVPLQILESPYRSLVDPVVEFVHGFEKQHRKDRNRFCMIVLPVFVTRHRWENLLHNQSTILLRQALRKKGTRVVTTVGFYL